LTKHSDSKSSFESSLKRLEKIVETLEQGNVPLEDAMKMFEEGIELSRSCMERLTQAELKLKKLARKVDGSFEISDLEKEDLG